MRIQITLAEGTVAYAKRLVPHTNKPEVNGFSKEEMNQLFKDAHAELDKIQKQYEQTQ